MKKLWQTVAVILCVFVGGCVAPSPVKSLDAESQRILLKAEPYLKSDYCLILYKTLGISRGQLEFDPQLTKSYNFPPNDENESKVVFKIKGSEKPGGNYMIMILLLDLKGQLIGCGYGDSGGVSGINN